MTSSGSRRFLVLVDPLLPTDARIRYAFALLDQKPDMRASELASAVNLSTSRLQHLFKTQAGVSIDDYSMDLRLQRAEELVRTTFRSFKEIGQEVGIWDHSNFSRYFKKRFELSPSAYRKAIGSGVNHKIADFTTKKGLTAAD